MPDMCLTPDQLERMQELLVAFKLPTINAELVRRLGDAGFGDALPVVLEVFEAEADARRERRVERLLRSSQLPPGKTLDTFDLARLPRPLATKIREVVSGEFVDRAVNVLCFGLPGVGKSHVAAGIGHELVRRGRSVFFAPTYEVVQHLLAAKRDLALPRALRKLDLYDLVVLDDLGYVQQSPEEAEVLFTLVSERYERRSLMITSNLVFSEWERIFRNAMATAAAIDRLVHHSVILEFASVITFRNPDPDNAGAATAPSPEEVKNGRKPRSSSKTREATTSLKSNRKR